MSIEQVGFMGLLKAKHAVVSAGDEPEELYAYFRPTDIACVREMGKGVTRLDLAHLGPRFGLTLDIYATGEEVIEAVRNSLLPDIGLPGLVPLTPEAEADQRAQRIKEQEEMGAAMARGMRRGLDESDRDTWGRPGED